MYTRLRYNTNNGLGTKWNQYGGTGITLTVDMKTRMTERSSGNGSDPIKLGRWTWFCIGGKDNIATTFVSAYCPCKNVNGLNTVWNQQARYFKQEKDIEVPDVHALFIRYLCRFLGDL